MRIRHRNLLGLLLALLQLLAATVLPLAHAAAEPQPAVISDSADKECPEHTTGADELPSPGEPASEGHSSCCNPSGCDGLCSNVWAPALIETSGANAPASLDAPAPAPLVSCAQPTELFRPPSLS